MVPYKGTYERRVHLVERFLAYNHNEPEIPESDLATIKEHYEKMLDTMLMFKLRGTATYQQKGYPKVTPIFRCNSGSEEISPFVPRKMESKYLPILLKKWPKWETNC